MVTGGSLGIGFSIAKRLLEEGASVSICARNRERLNAARDLLGSVTTHPLDVGNREEIISVFREIVQQKERIDILVNNAGIAPQNRIDQENDTWPSIIQVNLTGTYWCCKEALRWMPNGGRILNISSILGTIGVAEKSAYCASKHGINGLTKALALEVAHRNIPVNALAPTWVDTDMARDSIEEIAHSLQIPPQDFRKAEESALPLQRFLQPHEVAEWAFYILSTNSMTGQIISLG